MFKKKKEKAATGSAATARCPWEVQKASTLQAVASPRELYFITEVFAAGEVITAFLNHRQWHFNVKSIFCAQSNSSYPARPWCFYVDKW
jgi:hypothetical protein